MLSYPRRARPSPSRALFLFLPRPAALFPSNGGAASSPVTPERTLTHTRGGGINSLADIHRERLPPPLGCCACITFLAAPAPHPSPAARTPTLGRHLYCLPLVCRSRAGRTGVFQVTPQPPRAKRRTNEAYYCERRTCAKRSTWLDLCGDTLGPGIYRACKICIYFVNRCIRAL